MKEFYFGKFGVALCYLSKNKFGSIKFVSFLKIQFVF